MRRLAAIFAAVAFITLPHVSFAITYPSPVGHVNDFANIIPANVKQNLETKLREYQNKTSIEIVVVTVRSLEGMSEADYTIGLARSWGVGDKQKNNGVVLLVAPNERKVRIETGYGIEADLTDSQAGVIIRDNIIPYFKQGRMVDGIVAGVSGITLELGEKPYETRLEERKAALDKKRIEEEKSAQEFKIFLTVAGIVIAIVVVVLVIGFSIRSLIRRGKKLKTLQKNNSELLQICGKKIDEAEREYPQIQEQLNILKGISPKEVWADLDKRFRSFPEWLKNTKESLPRLSQLHDKGQSFADSANEKLTSLFNAINTEAGLYEAVKSKIKEVKNAQKNGPLLLRAFPKEVEKTEDKISHPDVSDKTKNIIAEARAKYEVAKSLSGNQAVNWILILNVLATGAVLLANAVSSASSDKAAAEERRKPKPKPRPSPRPSSRSQSDDGYVAVGSSWSSGSSSSSDSGSSFGGFGGGSFGGGGASGSW